MKILMINKYLYPNGGSETYMIKLGEQLQKMGHQVQYFGMRHEGNIVGNKAGAYTSNMDFHKNSRISMLPNAIKTIYSKEARTQIRKVLDEFRPDVCHLNNFNYQLTPSIILEIKKWNKDCKIIYTAHDGQLVCPNHALKNPNTNQLCEKCLGGEFLNCVKGKCIHGSTAKSIIGTSEALFWKAKGVYKYLDKIICCSEFMKKKLDSNSIFASKTVTMHNFIDNNTCKQIEKKDYVLYFGRFSEEKGIKTLVAAAKELPEIQFVFAGKGPLEDTINSVRNIQNVGFKTSEELNEIISKAKLSICPSECYDNCPLSVMESIVHGTPVVGADIGGIPELILPGVTGELFESGNVEELKKKIKYTYDNYAKYCNKTTGKQFDTISDYCTKLISIYSGEPENDYSINPNV